MNRLSRRPCAQCATDTLHKALTCLTCGHVEQMAKNSTIINARRAARMRGAGMNTLQISAALFWNTMDTPYKKKEKGAAHVRCVMDARKVRQHSRQRHTIDGKEPEAPVLRGRERTWT